MRLATKSICMFVILLLTFETSDYSVFHPFSLSPFWEGITVLLLRRFFDWSGNACGELLTRRGAEIAAPQ